MKEVSHLIKPNIQRMDSTTCRKAVVYHRTLHYSQPLLITLKLQKLPGFYYGSMVIDGGPNNVLKQALNYDTY